MEARFEDDLVELAGDGNYLMLCAERQLLFLDGAAAGKLPLAEIAGLEARGDAVVVRRADGTTEVQPFPSAGPDFAAEAAVRLNSAAAAWR